MLKAAHLRAHSAKGLGFGAGQSWNLLQDVAEEFLGYFLALTSCVSVRVIFSVKGSCRPQINKPPPLNGIVIRVLILRPLKGGGLFIMGLH